MKSINEINKNGYYLGKNPDTIPSTKYNNYPRIIGSGAREIAFGELIVNDELKIEGQLIVLEGTEV